MGATLEQFVRGLHGAVTREDAKKLARLHGHRWKTVLKRMKRHVGPGATLFDVMAQEQRESRTLEGDIVSACEGVARYGGTPDLAIIDGVEVRRGE